jgi:hypothetical protein
MSEESEQEIDYEDDHAADYMEEAIRDYQEQQRQERYERLPALCKRCRWLDWYYVEGCVHWRYPQDGKCALYTRHIYFHHPQWLQFLAWNIQYAIWDWRTRRETGKFSAPIGTALDDDELDEDSE